MVEIHEWYIWIVSCQLPPSKCGVYKWWVCMFEDIAQMFLLYFLIANCVYGRLHPWHLFSFGVNWRWIILQGLLIIWEKKKNLMDVEIWKCEALDPIQKNSKMREAASSDLNGLVSGGETSWEAPSSEPQSRDFPSWGLKASCSCICRCSC